MKPRSLRAWLAVATLAAALTGACHAPAPVPTQRVPLAEFAAALRPSIEMAVIDIGTPASRAALHEGWGPLESTGATTFSWGAGPLSRLSFDLVQARNLELRLRGWSFPFDGGVPQRVEVRVNGRPVGAQVVETAATTLRFLLPAATLRTGENLLELRYGRWNERPGERPWAVAWDGLRLGPGGEREEPRSIAQVQIDPAGGSLFLPAGAALETTLELPVGTRLAWESVVADKGTRLELTVEADGEAAIERRVTSKAAGSFELTGNARTAGLVRFALRAPGTSGGVRVGGLHLELPMASGDASVDGKPITVLLPAAPAAAPSVTGAESTLPELRPNLIIYLIDTLRADHLGCYGYARPTSPHIDRFAAESIRFENGRAQSSWTKPAVATVLTGLYPVAHGAELRSQRIHESVDTLAERLQAVGYETALFTTNANIVARFGFDQGWDSFQYLAHRRGRKHEHLDAAEMNTEIFAWLAARERRRPTKPLFLFVHTLDPHDPYRPREEFRDLLAPGVDVETECCLRTPQLAALPEVAARNHARAAMALYDAEIAQNDAAFGDFLDELERRGLARTSAVLLTADHGEEFFDHGGWKHGFTLYEEMLRIPFVLRLPASAAAAARGRTVATPVDQVDIAPTLLALAGAATAADLPGRDVQQLVGPERTRTGASWPSFAWLQRPGAESTSTVAGGLKLLLFAGDRGTPGWTARLQEDRPALLQGAARELYDLARDPGEHANLLDLERRRPLRELWLEGKLASALARHGGGAAAEEAEIDPDLERSLRALGYF